MNKNGNKNQNNGNGMLDGTYIRKKERKLNKAQKINAGKQGRK